MVNELDDNMVKRYHEMIFAEFCEFVARLIDKLFLGSELEELPLHEKLEYILEDLLPLVDQKFIGNRTVVEEFSESDSDY